MRTADGYIINKCLNGDSAAFGLLVDKYRTGVYALAYSKLRNFHDAEDVAQEVFIKAYRKLRTLKQFDSFHAWLYAITSNLCKDWLRARDRRPDRDFIEDQDMETLEVPYMNAHREELVYELIHEALDSLSETYQQVLTLYYLGGMNSREIAEFLGTSPAAVRERLSRGRSQLKEGMLAMMSMTFETQKLHESFTFRIVEAVKRTKIQPMPKATGLPWGLSLAAGIIAVVLSLNPHLSSLNPMFLPMGAPLPSKAKVLKTGEIPVDILEVDQILVLASKQGEGDGGEPERPDPKNADLMIAHGKGNTWRKRTSMPTGRTGLSAGVVNGRIYAIGGMANTTLSTVEEYRPTTNTWTVKTSMLTARGTCTSVVNGNIYAIGGASSMFDALSTVEEYNPLTDTWTTKTDMPTARWGHSTSAVNGRIYAIGGTSSMYTPMSTVEEYDPLIDAWTTKADMPTARQGLSTSVVNGRIYAIGGSNIGTVWLPGSPIVEEYDPATNMWTTGKADMPTARNFLSTSVVNNMIYAIGGRDGLPDGLANHRAVEVYDPVNDSWSKKADMPTGRAALATSAVDGMIYAIGGSYGIAELPIVGFSHVEEYDTGFVPLNQAVEAKGKLPTMWGAMKERRDTAKKRQD